MRKFILPMLGAATLCMPTIASASHEYNLPSSVMNMQYDSEEDCEDALAMARNSQRKNGNYEGKERGMFNKMFNARYQCEEMQSGKYMIKDYRR